MMYQVHVENVDAMASISISSNMCVCVCGGHIQSQISNNNTKLTRLHTMQDCIWRTPARARTHTHT